MTQVQKGRSPFYPGQPVPAELFEGRSAQVEHILERGVRQVEAGKPVAMFVEGEYGIGKSSIAGFAQWLAERDHGVHAIYASLAAAESMEDVGAAVLEGTIRSGVFNPTRGGKIREWLAKYVGQQQPFGFTIHAEVLRKDAPAIVASPSGTLDFLGEAVRRLAGTGVRGVFLVLDEINGVMDNPRFAHFIKGLVDSNAMSRAPVPLLLMLCGVEERRREMIQRHQPVDRIFDVVQIKPMSPEEMVPFFDKAFGSVSIRVERDAMDVLTWYSAGFPKIMHLIGDAAFWTDRDGVIAHDDAVKAVVLAAEEVWRQYVDQQVFGALRSDDYRSILDKIAGLVRTSMTFKRADVAALLTDTEKRKFGNFLQKMKRLNVLRPDETQGEYAFTVRMVQLYLWLRTSLEAPASQPPHREAT